MNALKKARLQRMLTLGEAALGSGMSSAAVWNLEQGGTPSVRSMRKLSQFYGMPAHALFPDLPFWDDNEQEESNGHESAQKRGRQLHSV